MEDRQRENLQGSRRIKNTVNQQDLGNTHFTGTSTEQLSRGTTPRTEHQSQHLSRGLRGHTRKQGPGSNREFSQCLEISPQVSEEVVIKTTKYLELYTHENEL